ncbi:MAG: DedA family protein [Candidatus Nanoarchaeia archaeon]|nr:DedA family protein [Candidatus Nanoarchaeia archaeon]MDD5358472.1 DedA family protein [Candidatus Nanoarchaeia archaeon]MDD5588986.1 DedA family protein [Candidatus Nanoarchaeia archaeon]
MDLVGIVNFFLNLDTSLAGLISTYGVFVYVLLFLVVFVETGLVIIPFLPGDSFLFAAGTFAGIGSLNLFLIFVLLSSAAILGDSLNYFIGKYVGPRVFKSDTSKFFKKEHLISAEKFYEKHGAKAIVYARFIPIIRTFAPFVAGIGKMKYRKFLLFNIFGGILWVSLFVFGGYFFGNIPLIRENFELAILTIIFISLIPPLIGWIKHRKKSS